MNWIEYTSIGRKLNLLVGLFFLIYSLDGFSQTQLPECNSGVPFFNIDLSGNPDSTYYTPEIVRKEQCCSGQSNENYVSIYVQLHPDVAMIEMGIMPGYADPGGSGFYNIINGGNLTTPGTCGADIQGGTSACIIGSGPHKITYHKPGKNRVRYYVRQIPKPIFPPDDSTRVGCSKTLNIYGLDSIEITSINSSNGNTTQGAYDGFLDCTNCSSPSFTPGLGSPDWIEYQICGSPQASACGSYQSCDTVRLYIFNQLLIEIDPDPATFCEGGSGVNLTATASGGLAPYSFIWRNSSSDTVSQDSTYLATEQGSYTVEVSDQLTGGQCFGSFMSSSVLVSNPPVVNAGQDDTVCASDPTVTLSGMVQYATGGYWTGGSGTFNPSNSSLITAYTPTSAEIGSGSVTMTLHSSGAGGGCADSTDQVTIFFTDTVQVNPLASEILCNGGVSSILANASSGVSPYSYQWSTGSTSSSILAPAGSYGVSVTDSRGCEAFASVSATQPDQLSLNLSSTNTSQDTACDGTASVSANGGVAPYQYVWDNGDTTSSIDSLCYGTVSVTVTDSNGCVITGSVVVNKPSCSAFEVTANDTSARCYGDTTSVATCIATGGVTPYTYAWSTTPVQTTSVASNLAAGTYTVAVTDSNGCIDVATINISQPSALTNSMTHTNVTSIGGSNGTATANPQGGTPGYTYSWTTSPVQSSQTATNLSAGVYTVEVADQNTCILYDSVLINQPPCNNFQIAVNSTNVSCNGDNDGSASLFVFNGVEPYTIHWSTGDSNQTMIGGLTAGTYGVTITDSTFCTSFQTFSITEPDTLTIGLEATNITCWGKADGTIDLTATGGVFPYSFQWYKGLNPYAEHEDLSNLSPGTYSAVVMDANGCEVSASVGVTQPDKLTATYSSIDALCNGDSNGSINAVPSGGILPYSFAWEGPSSYASSSEDITDLSFGLYTFEFTDANGCILSPKMEVYINQPDTVIIHNVLVDCPNPSEQVTLVTVDSVSGGAEGSYSFSFDNGLSFGTLGDDTATLLVASSYDVWARDSNGCTSLDPFPVSIDPLVSLDSIQFNPCIGPGDTVIQVSVYVSGGDGGDYDVSFDGGQTFQTDSSYIFNLGVGSSYEVIARDGKGCLTLSEVINIPEELIVQVVQVDQVTCLGGNDGSMTSSATGGAQPYQYTWSGPGSFSSDSSSIYGLVSGFYSLTITDTNGCSASAGDSVTTVPDVTMPEISCPSDIEVDNDSGLCGALVTYNTPVGTDNCPGVSTTLIAGLSSGSLFDVGETLVTYQAVDTVGNSATCSFTVTVNDTAHPVIASCPSDLSSATDSNQCSSVVSWTEPTASDNCGIMSFTSNFNSGDTFSLGTTQVIYTAVDSNNNVSQCVFNVTVIDSQAPSITNCPENLSVSTDTSSCGAFVSWIPPSAFDNCSGVSMSSSHNPGAYFTLGTTTVVYTISDSVGNVDSCSFTIEVIDSVAPEIICPANINTCDSIVVYGSPYASDNCAIDTVYLSSGLGSGSVFPVGLNLEEFTVIDQNGNSNVCVVEVLVNPIPEINLIVQDVGCYGDSTGSISSEINSGTPPYNYTWSNGATTPDIGDLYPGFYTLQVIDSNGCSSSESAEVSEPDLLVTSYQIDSISCYNDLGGIHIVTTGGTLPYTYLWNNGSQNSSLDSLSGGTYTLTVTDSNSCRNELAIDLLEPDSLYVTGTAVPAICENDNGEIDISVFGGTIPYSFEWSNGATTEDLLGVGFGSYSVTVLDKNGCQAFFSDSVQFLSNFSLSATIKNVNCYGESNGSIELLPSDGAETNIYEWSNGASSQNVFGLEAGIYGVTVTDSNNCVVFGRYEITQNDSIELILESPLFYGLFNISKHGESDGSIDLTVLGGASPFDYLWSNGSTLEDLTELTAGEYSVVVTDLNGCTAFGGIVLTEPDDLDIPEGISPNADGYNDYFIIKGIEAYPDNELIVFNRWGNIVYQKEGYANEWNGQNNNGKDLPDATYFILLRVEEKDQVYEGFVDVRRK